jgi:hypothetical protein
VESTRAETEPERLRASEVTKSKVVRESAEQDADAAYYTEQKAADAQLYKQKMAADATCKSANLLEALSPHSNYFRLSSKQRSRC